MRKVGLILILGIFVISTFFIFYSINSPISDSKSDENRNTSEISYDQKDQPKRSDTFEPNNAFSSAAWISEGYYAGLNLSSASDEDWFYIWIDSYKSITVNLYFLHSNGDIDLELYNSTNDLLMGNYSITDDESITYVVNNPNYYYIRVYYQANPNYDLEIIIDDEFEPNNDFDSAIYLDKGYYSYLMCKNDDWFKFWVNKDEEFNVEILFSHSSGDLDIELYDNNSIFLTGSYSGNDNEMIKWTAEYTGEYYIHIYNFAVDNSYDLDIYINTWWDDKYEYNNDFWSAREVFKGLKHNLKCQDDDWYMIHVNFGETITIDVYFSNDTGNLDLELYDSTYSWLDGSYSWDDDEKISFTASYTGYYFIRVYKNSFYDDNDYQMKIIGQEITIFYEDFEGPISPNWSGINEGNYMHVTSRDFSPESPFNSLWCGNESTGFYNKIVDGKDIAYKESAIINDLDLRDFCYVELTFDAKLNTGGSSSDYAYISVKLLGDEYYLSPKYTNHEFKLGGSTADMGWQNVSIDLSFFSGYEHVDLAFNFEVDDFNNYYEGIMIDNVRIIGIVDSEFLAYDLGIHEGDEFYYYFPHIDTYGWSEIFGKEIPSYYDESIKIKIMSINDMGSYWEVTVLFWEPWDDFDEYTGTDEIKYQIYKNPINMKEGNDFFIPSGDLGRFFEKADNFDSDWSSYDIKYWYDWGKYNIQYSFDDFTVDLIYFSNGILSGMIIQKNYGNYDRIFEMWLGDPPEDQEDEKVKEEGRSIPGYNMILIYFAISAAFIVSVIKFKKSKNIK